MRANAAVRVPPTTWLSTDYTVATHCQNEHCLLAIVPAYDDTVVSITLRLRNSDTNNGSSPTLLYDDVVFRDGDVITEVLNQSLAMQVLCSACDMSGTRVVSSQPVAVLSGGEVTSAGDTSTTHDITLEFIPPTSSLGTQYILATNPTNFAYTVKIVATQSGTRISVFGECLTTGEDSDAWTLDYPADRQSTVLEASEPVLVALIIEDATSPGDVRMVVLVPTSHWSSTGYEVVKPFPTSTNSLMIVVGVADMYAVRFSLGGQWLRPRMSSPSIELVQDMPDLAVIFVPIDQEQCHLSLTCNAFSSSACQPFWGYVGGAMVGNGGWALPLALLRASK
nr:hypothetical protein BaRGS_016759 [Batillaria attramentaria]